jgi:hypothetical protein
MAYNFTAASSRYLSAVAPLNGLNYPWTACLWFNPSADNVNQACLSIHPNSGQYFGVSIGGGIAGKPFRCFHSSNTVATAAESTSAFSANIWQHGAAIFESNASRTIYLDGANSATNTTAANAQGASTEIFIGARRLNGVIAGYFGGLIAEVGIWSAALTAEEVASLAKGMTCDKVRPQSLVFYAPLVRDLQDVRGGLTITNNNGATVATHPRVYA